MMLSPSNITGSVLYKECGECVARCRVRALRERRFVKGPVLSTDMPPNLVAKNKPSKSKVSLDHTSNPLSDIREPFRRLPLAVGRSVSHAGPIQWKCGEAFGGWHNPQILSPSGNPGRQGEACFYDGSNESSDETQEGDCWEKYEGGYLWARLSEISSCGGFNSGSSSKETVVALMKRRSGITKPTPIEK